MSLIKESIDLVRHRFAGVASYLYAWKSSVSPTGVPLLPLSPLELFSFYVLDSLC